MEYPTYTPKVVHPKAYAIEPGGSSVSVDDWVIPEREMCLWAISIMFW
jgi:hypothetical protein